MVIAGCEKIQPAGRPANAAIEPSAQAVKAPQKKPLLLLLEESKASGTWKTPDMPSYQWPADFKLPLEINMEAPDVPEELQSPSPPIEEEKNSRGSDSSQGDSSTPKEDSGENNIL